MAKRNSTPANVPMTPSLPAGPAPVASALGASDQIVQIPLTAIHADWNNNLSRLPDPSTPIATYLEWLKTSPKFVSLMKSIREQGLLSALVVRPRDPVSGLYPLVGGYNRHYACSLINPKASVKVIIKETDAKTGDILNLIDNVERTDLSTFQLASAFQALYRRHQMTSSQVAKQLSKTDGYVRALTMCRENLAPAILKAWAERDVLMEGSDDWKFPLERKATNTPNLQSLASMKLHVVGCNGKKGRDACDCPPDHAGQLAEFAVIKHVFSGKSEEEARKLVQAEGGYQFPKPAEKPPRPAAAKTTVKLEEVAAVKTSLEAITNAGEAEDYVDGALALCRYFLGETDKVKIGRTVLYQPPAITSDKK